MSKRFDNYKNILFDQEKKLIFKETSCTKGEQKRFMVPILRAKYSERVYVNEQIIIKIYECFIYN